MTGASLFRSGRVFLLYSVLLIMLMSACARLPLLEPRGDPTGDLFHASMRNLEEGRFERASQGLRRISASCDSGAWGERAVLVLAAVELDPRNPRGRPGAAALLSSRYLQVPSAPPELKAVARSLYLAALDLGASSVEDPFGPVPRPAAGEAGEGAAVAGYWRVANRFESCDGEAPPRELAAIPTHPGRPLALRHRQVVEELDSLAAGMDSLSAAGDALVRQVTEREALLRARVDSLTAELDRIRGLLESGLGTPRTPPGRP